MYHVSTVWHDQSIKVTPSGADSIPGEIETITYEFSSS